MKSLLVTVCCLLIFSTPVMSGPPLLTSDTGTPGDGHWEINLGSTTERTLAHFQTVIPDLDFNYGLGDRIQLKFEIPMVFSKVQGRETQNGIGSSVAGIKWRFLDEGRQGVAMSTYPQVQFNIAKSSEDKGLVDKGTKWLLPVEVEKKIGPVNVTGELGYIYSPETENQWYYGLAFGYRTSKRIEWVGEIFGVTASNFDWASHDLVLNLGFRWNLIEWLNLNVSVGRSLHNADNNEKTFLSYVGVQFVF